jgi:transcription-repair coupling factor (superfamily II helicase)
VATRPEPRLLTDWSAFLPDDYVPDEHEKLSLYRRLAEAGSLEALDDLVLEMLDRFGQLPSPAVALFELRRLRLLGRGGDVESLRVFQQVVEVVLRHPLQPKAIAGLVGSFNFQIEFMSGREFGMRVRGEGLALLNRARDLLQGLEAVKAGG